MKVEPGKTFYTYSAEEVIWLHDKDHTPFNKRSGSVESDLKVEVRAPLNADYVSFSASETTRKSGTPSHMNRTRVISFSITREQFEAIVAHVNRKV